MNLIHFFSNYLFKTNLDRFPVKSRFIVLITLFLCFHNSLFAQEEEFLKVTPISPTVSGLGKYIDFPISLYTGQAEVNVPIYNLTVKDIQVPISLRYHTGGVRVEEIASSVGLGWSLIANGTITRRINGTIDGLNTFFYEDPPYILDANKYSLHKNSTEGGIDTEHDYYYYSAGDYNGKYIIDFKNNNTPVQFPVQDIKIENGSPIKITTPDGLIYTYGVSESNSSLSLCSNSSSSTGSSRGIPTAWFLTKIESQTSDAFVGFFYESKILEYEQNGSQIKYENIVAYKGDSDCEITNYITTQRLIAIETSDGQRVDFISGSERADLKNDYILTDIAVTSTQSSFSKRFKLNHKYLDGSYFRDITYYNPVAITDNTREKLRLVLMDVQEIGNDNSVLPPYSFEYNIVGQGLPSRRSFSQDHWGYYNGKANNTLVPAIIFNQELLTGADRKPDFLSAIQGTLSKINFPTGGSKSFVYELNECDNCSFLDFTTIGNSQIQYETHSIGDNDYFANQYESLIEIPFEVDGVRSGEVILDMATETNYYHFGFSQSEIEFKLYSLNQDNTINEIIFDSNSQIYVEGLDEDEINSLHVRIDYNFSGKYKLQLKVNNHQWASNQDWYSLQVKWLLPQNGVDFPSYKNAGGLRTKQIETYDPVTNKTIKKNYTYEGGFLSGWQSYARRLKYVAIQQGRNITWGSAISRTSNPIISISNTKGGIVGYGKVSVIEQGNGFVENYFYSSQQHPDQGWGEENYATVLDVPNNGISLNNYVTNSQDWYYPFSLDDEKDWKRGILEKQITYKEDGSLIRKVENKYFFYDNLEPSDPSYSNKVYTVKGSRSNAEMAYPFFETVGGSISVNFYSLESSWYDLDEVITTDYFDNSEELITSTKYEYSPHHRSIKSTLFTDSMGDVIKSTSLYPPDFNTGINEDIAIEMVDRNLINQPLLQKKEVKYINNNSTNALEIQKTFDLNNGNINLIKTQTFTKEFSEPITYNLTSNDFGNITQVNRTNSINVVYLWGYKNSYPVAKVENATYSEVSSFVNQTIFDKPSSPEALRSELQKIRTGLPNAMVTTYTYDPLIGVTSITDPRGETIYYEYDEFNRLKQVKDADGNILSENEYHYKRE